MDKFTLEIIVNSYLLIFSFVHNVHWNVFTNLDLSFICSKMCKEASGSVLQCATFIQIIKFVAKLCEIYKKLSALL